MPVIPDIDFELSKIRKNPYLFGTKYIAEIEWKHPSRRGKKFDKSARIDDNYRTIEECRLGSNEFILNLYLIQ